MLKCYNYDIVCQEIPSEVTLAFNISNCPIHCPGCHSTHLWEDVGKPFDTKLLATQIDKYDGDITCVCFMGGDASYLEVAELCRYVRDNYPELKTAWWSGRTAIPEDFDLELLDFIKIGPYIQALGGLKSPTTNQALYRNVRGRGLEKIIFTLALLIGLFCPAISSLAQEDSKWNLSLDVYDKFYFDNREFDAGTQGVSGTIFGNRFLPVVGLTYKSQAGENGIKFGPMVTHSMGVEGADFKFPVWIEHSSETFTLQAGVIPSNYLYEVNAPTAFFSEAHIWQDPTIEGLILRWKEPSHKYDYLLALDWMGQYSPQERERFMVSSFGHHKLLQNLSLGYDFYYYHLACSMAVDGVVDNALVHPYVATDFLCGDVAFDLRLGWLQALQQERLAVGHYVFPGGVMADQNVSWRNFFLRNSAYYGQGLQPYYNSTDAAGNVYGNLLYFGDPLYNFTDTILYDRCQVGYGREIVPGLRFSVSAVFHFNTIEEHFFSGFTQVFSLIFQ